MERFLKNKNFTHLFLPAQFSGLQLPDIELIDMKREILEKDHWVSKKIIKTLNESLKNGEQCLLFLNRRGYSPLV